MLIYIISVTISLSIEKKLTIERMEDIADMFVILSYLLMLYGVTSSVKKSIEGLIDIEWNQEMQK